MFVISIVLERHMTLQDCIRNMISVIAKAWVCPWYVGIDSLYYKRSPWCRSLLRCILLINMSYNQGYGNQQMSSGGAYNDPTIQTAPNSGFEQAYGTGNDVYDSGNPGGGTGFGANQQSGIGYDRGNAVNTGQNVGGYDNAGTGYGTTQSTGGYNDTSGYNSTGYDTTQASGGGFNDDTAGGYGNTRTGYDTTQSSGGGFNDNVGGYGGSTQQQQGYGGAQQQGFDTGNAQQAGLGQQQGFGQQQQPQQQSFDPSQTSDYGQQQQQSSGSQHRPSAGEKIKGGLEKLAGKLTGNPAKAAHGDDVAHGRSM